MCELFGGFGDNLEYFSSTNSLFRLLGVLEIFVDNKYISVIFSLHHKNYKQNPLDFKHYFSFHRSCINYWECWFTTKTILSGGNYVPNLLNWFEAVFLDGGYLFGNWWWHLCHWQKLQNKYKGLQVVDIIYEINS